ncbi:MBL fold metallo-hydrolase [Deinococcus maricopensis]|uniref:Beta-lactamase domain protein n=1 Tax=Deinococcus maricopensis (strain DSM 21211 / LMG 22137 / NRRL B-23946 / LB-34) TaxID=709986 RepID=E8U5U7_DEIML|nr:MBL fold metallo-hydrolase [Deinococcus maricopensis]ADV66436.1 beta-lactamase domain protein [Deinococcus maricopensis DSM 21211]
MKLTEHVHVLPLHEPGAPASNTMHLSLILDDARGATLVDTGLPGREEAVLALLREAGASPGDVRRIVLTHQDLDHVGSAAALARMTGAQVLAHADDAPFIDGRQRAVKLPPPSVLSTLPPGARAMMKRGADPVTITRTLADGEVLDVAGGVRMLHTPGHTPGHLSLYVPSDRVLIAGDAVVVHDGQLAPPPAPMTPDMPAALQSIRKLAALDADIVVAYHGGVQRGDVRAQLRTLAPRVSF